MRTIQRAIRSSRSLVLGLAAAVALATASTARAAGVLDQVPSDAAVVWKINHLQDTSTKLAGLFQALGITDFVPTMSDPLTAIQNETGMSAGVDKAGDAAAVLLNGHWDQMDEKPPIVILMPVSDYKAFVAGMTPVRTEGDVAVVHFKNDQSTDTFVANWGSYAAISPMKEAVAKPASAGLKAGGLAGKQLAERDAVIYVNWPVLKPVLLPKLQQGHQQLLQEVDRAFAHKANLSRTGGGGDPSPVLKALVDQAVNVAQSFLTDSTATTWGFSIEKAGISSTMLSEFSPGSYAANMAGQVKSTDQSVMNGLPSDKYLFYGGGVMSPEVGVKALDDFSAPIVKELGSMGTQGDAIKALVDSYRDAIQASQRGAFGMVAPNPNTPGGLFQIVGVYKGDAEKLKAAQIKQVQTQDAVMKSLGVPNSDLQKTTVTPNASTVDGVSFDEMKIAFDGQAKTAQAMQAQQAMAFMYGPNGFIMRTAVIDPKTMVSIAGGNDELVSKVVAAAKADKDVLSQTDVVKGVDAELPKTRAFAMYIPLDTIVSTAVGYAGKFGFPVPVQLPPNLPPIGVTAGTEGSAYRVDGYVPTQLIQSLIQAGMQVYLQMRGGQGGGGGGGAGGGGL
ncbi:MAG TPA: hypothetical protein VLI90_07365 [Tepidisphaeraceae bacterium]|nr:hypothetical protein [Tepidisphaeraceae bacterium]